MIGKECKAHLLNRYVKKEEKILVGSVIDKANKTEISNHLTYTNFLDINQKNIAVQTLNSFNISYYLFKPLVDTSRFVIFFLPDYVELKKMEHVVGEYVTVLKIVPKSKDVITHREYMGAIYSLGLKEDMIGDIFVYENNCYLFCFKQNEKYISDNLTKVAKSYVNIISLNPFDDEVGKVKLNIKSIDIIVPSLRIDVVLSELFNLTRNIAKAKINEGDLFVNSKEMYFAAYNVQNDDIISFRKCGKFKVGSVQKVTKSGKIVLNIQKYI